MNGQSTRSRAKFSRREFLLATASAGAALAFARWQLAERTKHSTFQLKRKIPGSIKGASSQAGHLIRQSMSLEATSESKTDVVIVGSGIAALSAAWWLQKNGVEDFLLLELEKNPGGNSQSDQNAVTRFPWGAHYLPLPTDSGKYVIELLEEAGVIVGRDANGRRIYKDEFLCHDPKERLFQGGQWQDSMIPSRGLRVEEDEEIERFLSLIESFKMRRGRDGKAAFAVPIEMSSKDKKLRDLDKISLADYLKSQGFQSQPLGWYVDYCCRDDFGVGAEKVSAWIGLQYFAARAGQAANAEENSVLTWPEGNGYLVDYLRKSSQAKIQTESLVTRIEVLANGAEVSCLDITRNELAKIQSKQVIFAAPRFTAPYLIHSAVDSERVFYPRELEYDPWMVANITLSSHPEGEGAPLSWDNVSYYGKSLGYVVATHQKLSPAVGKTVLTMYWPLSEGDPKSERQRALERSHDDWVLEIVRELVAMHPTIEESIENIDVWIWGHAMARPSPGFIWGAAREKMKESFGKNIHFAHSDMSGYSVFEEAQFWGVTAARKVIARLGTSSG